MKKNKNVTIRNNLWVYDLNSASGITLVALVITIIVMLILAGVSISMVVADNGIINQATTAVSETRKATATEEVQMAWIGADTEHWNEWTKNTSTVKANFFTIENLNKYLADVGEVTELDYVENGISTVKYLRYEENLEYTVKIYNTGRAVIEVEPEIPIPKYDLATKAQIGDMVQYDAGDGVFDWENYSYNATAFATGENGTQNNFEASAYTGKWIVSNIDDNGYVYLISQNTVGNLFLKGVVAHNNLEGNNNILANICAIYANSDFAEEGIAPKSDNIADVRSQLTQNFWLNETSMGENLTAHYFSLYYIYTLNGVAQVAEVQHASTENENAMGVTCGVSPIIKLKYGIKTTGQNDAGEWVLY